MSRLNGCCILLVEDELLIALDLQMAMEDAGAVVVLADGVQTGLAALTEIEASGGRPDLALLDVRLGDGEVFPVAERCASSGVPIVFHSGHAQLSDLAEIYPSATVLSKPASQDALMNAIADGVA